jgi:hypothetical protein
MHRPRLKNGLCNKHKAPKNLCGCGNKNTILPDIDRYDPRIERSLKSCVNKRATILRKYSHEQDLNVGIAGRSTQTKLKRLSLYCEVSNG